MMNNPSAIEMAKNKNDVYHNLNTPRNIQTDMLATKNLMPYKMNPQNPQGESSYVGDNKIIFEIQGKDIKVDGSNTIIKNKMTFYQNYIIYQKLEGLKCFAQSETIRFIPRHSVLGVVSSRLDNSKSFYLGVAFILVSIYLFYTQLTIDYIVLGSLSAILGINYAIIQPCSAKYMLTLRYQTLCDEIKTEFVQEEASANNGKKSCTLTDVLRCLCFPCVLCYQACQKTVTEDSTWNPRRDIQIRTLKIYLKDKDPLLKINAIFGYSYGPLFHNKKVPNRKDVLQKMYYYNIFDYMSPLKNVGNILPI